MFTPLEVAINAKGSNGEAVLVGVSGEEPDLDEEPGVASIAACGSAAAGGSTFQSADQHAELVKSDAEPAGDPKDYQELDFSSDDNGDEEQEEQEVQEEEEEQGVML